jgi:MFS transporter, BCD family, chlorophyll transporter
LRHWMLGGCLASALALASQGRGAREGTRMGLWGAAQAIGFAVGGVAGTAASDLARLVLGSQVSAWMLVFAIEALLFVAAAVLALRIHIPNPVSNQTDHTAAHAGPGPQETAHERIAHL